MEEDISSSLSLKSEYEALFEMISYHTLNMENVIKQQNFHKDIFLSIDNPKPESQEFWNSGICFNIFFNVTHEDVRKHMDPFLDKIKNRISFILKNYDFSERKVWKLIRYQLDILKEYINRSNTKVLPIHIIFELSEILIILKRNIICLMIKIGPFDITSSDIKLQERDFSEYKIPEEFTEMYFAYLDILAKLIIKTNLATCDKFLNETFINCPYFIEVIKFFGGYVFTRDLFEVYNLEVRSNRLKKSSVKYTLINYIKELDNDTSNALKSLLETFKDYQNYSLVLITYAYNSSIFFQRIVKREGLTRMKNEDRDVSKYWVSSLREFLKYMYYFVNTKKGILFEYLNNYSCYIKVKNINNEIITSNRGGEKQNLLLPNFSLTRAILYLQHALFDFSSKFSFIVNESTSLDYIRLHYISFIKLYNKNLDFSSKLGDISKVLENCDRMEKRKKMKALIRDIYNDQTYLQIITFLCKFHLRCLFALAKNRNIDVTNKFYQLRIVNFMIKELDLEHDASEKVFKFKNFFNNKESENMDGNEKDMRGSLKLILDNLPQTKEDLVKLKYKPKQETVYEIKDDDVSQKSSLRNLNNYMQQEGVGLKQPKFGSLSNIVVNQDLSFEKKFGSSDRDEKNVIIEKLNDLNTPKKDEVEEEAKDVKDDEDNLSDYNSDDYSDDDSIMLVELKPKKNPYEDKIPKLNFMPTTLNLEGSSPQKMPAQVQQTVKKAEPVRQVVEQPVREPVVNQEPAEKHEGSFRHAKGMVKSLEFNPITRTNDKMQITFQNEDNSIKSNAINMKPLNVSFKNNAKDLNNSERRSNAHNESSTSKISQLKLSKSPIGSLNNSKVGNESNPQHERYESMGGLSIKNRMSMDLTSNINNFQLNNSPPKEKGESYRSDSQVKKTLMKNCKQKINFSKSQNA
jgi:hypothetical protein